MIDTLTYTKQLTESGVPRKQAEGHALAMSALVDNKLATKKDLQQLRLETKHDLKHLERKMEAGFKLVELRMTVRLGSIVVVSSGIMLALLTFIIKM